MFATRSREPRSQLCARSAPPPPCRRGILFVAQASTLARIWSAALYCLASLPPNAASHRGGSGGGSGSVAQFSAGPFSSFLPSHCKFLLPLTLQIPFAVVSVHVHARSRAHCQQKNDHHFAFPQPPCCNMLHAYHISMLVGAGRRRCSAAWIGDAAAEPLGACGWIGAPRRRRLGASARPRRQQVPCASSREVLRAARQPAVRFASWCPLARNVP